MDEVKVMDEQKRAESLNRPIEYDTTQYIVTQLGEEQYGIDIKYWILNERILGFFNTLFSYDNKTVTLYSDEFILKTDKPNIVDPFFTINYIFLYTLVLLFIGIIILSIQIETCIIIKLRPN